MLLVLEYFVQRTENKRNALKTDRILIEQVESVMLSNRKKEQVLVDSLKEDYIGRARAVSYIIDKDPSAEYDLAELKRMAQLLLVDEIHLFDTSGTIYSGTVPEYYGFTFDSGEQMNFFKPILHDTSLALCQDVTPNTAEGKSMMYAICWNEGKTRLTQIGIAPVRLLSELRANEIAEVIFNMATPEGVEIVVADKTTGELLGTSSLKRLGTYLSDLEIDFPSSDLSRINTLTQKIDGELQYCVAHEFDSFVILVMYSAEAANKNLTLTMFMTFTYLVLASIVILLIVKQLSGRILQKQSEAEQNAQASKAKSAFLANMSHEIRTPINAVLGMDEMILRESDDEVILGYAKNIKNAGKNLLSIINDILDFSKIEAGKMELIPENYDVSSLVVDLVNTISSRAKSKNLRFVLKVDPHIPKTLYGDSVRIKQCVLNLLTNAVKYTKQGSVTLEMGFKPIDDSAIFLAVAVIDTGSGIRQEDMEKLFSPFERIDEGKNKTIEGTGLGMSIVTKTLALMQSRLAVQSEYGKGSIFSFAIQQAVVDRTEIGDIKKACDSSQIHIERYKEKLHASRAKLLFVDDTEMNLEVVKGLLKKTQIQIDTALSGMEALEKVKETAYDILFIDHRMPEMDGIQTLHAMQNLPDNKSVGKPCVALTANAIAGVRKMYLAEGFTDYLSKPVNPEKLEDMIRRYLPVELIEKTDADEAESKADSADTKSKENAAFLSQLEKIDGIDTISALENCGSAELLRATTERFCASYKETSAKLESAYSSSDWKNYGITVHSLKSTSRLVGAVSLSENARKLEENADKNEIAQIRENHKMFMENYRSCVEKFRPILSKNEKSEETEEKNSFSKEETCEKFLQILHCAQNFDIDGLDSLVQELASHKLPSGFTEVFEKTRDFVDKLQYKELIALISENKNLTGDKYANS